MTSLAVQCHCGAVTARLETATPMGELPYRACRCGFCRRHGAATTSDPAGRITIAAGEGALTRYRFGQKLSDFLICRTCGCYVGSAVEIEGGWYAILNIRGLDLPGFDGRTPEPMVYEDETPSDRIARRKARWSPATLTAATLQPSA